MVAVEFTWLVDVALSMWAVALNSDNVGSCIMA